MLVKKFTEDDFPKPDDFDDEDIVKTWHEEVGEKIESFRKCRRGSIELFQEFFIDDINDSRVPGFCSLSLSSRDWMSGSWMLSP